MELSPEQMMCVAEIFRLLWAINPVLMMQVSYWAVTLPLSIDWFVEIAWFTDDLQWTTYFLMEAVDALNGEAMELP